MPKWDPCPHADSLPASALSCRGRCAKCSKLAVSRGGERASKKAKRVAGAWGGRWSGAIRRWNAAKEGSPRDLAHIDLTYGKFVYELNQMDLRKKRGESELTTNVILAFAYFERSDRRRDAVHRELRVALRMVRCSNQSCVRLLMVGVVVGLRFTQSGKGAAKRMGRAAATGGFEGLVSVIRHIKCGIRTYRGVISRDQLADGALLDISKFILRSTSQIRSMSSLQTLAGSIIKRVALWTGGRQCEFHSTQVTYDLVCFSSLGIAGMLQDRHTVTPLKGSRMGLQILQAQLGQKSMSTIADAARIAGISQMRAQTTLGAYQKYARWWQTGIGRWYLELPACMCKR